MLTLMIGGNDREATIGSELSGGFGGVETDVDVDDRVAMIGSELSGGLGGGRWMAVTLTIGGGDIDDSQAGGDQSELET